VRADEGGISDLLDSVFEDRPGLFGSGEKVDERP
jgi:hypothetical protein